MDYNEFDKSLIRAAFKMAATDGWSQMRVAEAARRGGLALNQARARFPTRGSVLSCFGRNADAAALAKLSEGSRRDRLFDLLMRRIDSLQEHRAGVLALFNGLPAEPGTALMLGCASLASMRWMLEGAGVSSAGVRGALRAKGLLAVWLWTVRAWRGDESEDLSATMAALDQALNRAETADSWLGEADSAPGPGAPPPRLAAPPV